MGTLTSPAPRIRPRLPAMAYRTFQVVAPIATHFRSATCEEFGCDKWRNGWKTTFVAGTDKGDQIRQFIKDSPIRRQYRVVRLPGNVVEVLFTAGQSCFLQDHPTTRHRLPTGRPQIHVVRNGDWRVGVSDYLHSRRIHNRPEDWIDEFQTNQDRLKAIVERG
jgi:hypothetical protein